MRSSVSALNAQFGISGHLRFFEHHSGLCAIEINNNQCSANLILQGAHLIAWTPHGQQPVLWVSKNADFQPHKPIRGGIPVCWPWFGPHPSQSRFPSHGIARAALWEVVSTDAQNEQTKVSLRLINDEIKKQLWPHAAHLEIHFELGSSLEINLVSHNEGNESIQIGQALHSYFNVSDIANISLQGLDACFYLDKVDEGKRKQQHGAVKIDSEIDRIYLDTDATCLINDPGLQRHIRIEKRGSLSTVVWNPWAQKSLLMMDMGEGAYRSMLCVESANAAENTLTLGPAEKHHLWVRYSLVESLR